MMAMSAFTTATDIPLFSTAWTPRTPAAVAGTFIFLVVLSCIQRVLVALRGHQEDRWKAKERRRRYVVLPSDTASTLSASTNGTVSPNSDVGGSGGNGAAIADDKPQGRLAQRLLDTEGATRAVLSEGGVEENVVVVEQHCVRVGRPWRFSVDPLRAMFDVVIVGIGYLL